jgi:CDP-paratose 2-epimerase
MIECSAEPSVMAGMNGNPSYVINSNLVGTLNCLEAVRKNKATLIFLSTSRVYSYDELNKLDIINMGIRYDYCYTSVVANKGISFNGVTEQFTLAGPKTMYGATKYASEIMINEYAAMYGIKSVINRCGIIAGPGQFGKTDQGLLALWVFHYLFDKELTFIGFDGKGSQVRDFLDVKDLYRLIEIEITKINELKGNTFNVGGGRINSMSLHELTMKCNSIFNKKLKVNHSIETRPGDIKVYITDNENVYKIAGWKPRSDMTDILTDTMQWAKINKEKIRVLFNG